MHARSRTTLHEVLDSGTYAPTLHSFDIFRTDDPGKMRILREALEALELVRSAWHERSCGTANTMSSGSHDLRVDSERQSNQDTETR